MIEPPPKLDYQDPARRPRHWSENEHIYVPGVFLGAFGAAFLLVGLLMHFGESDGPSSSYFKALAVFPLILGVTSLCAALPFLLVWRRQRRKR